MRPALRVRAMIVTVLVAVTMGWSSSSAYAAVNYHPVPGRATVFSEQNGVTYTVRDGACEYQFKYTVVSPNGGIGLKAQVFGQLLAGTRCSVSLTAELYNWDTREFEYVDVVNMWEARKGQASGFAEWPLGDVRQRRGLTLHMTTAWIGDYVGSTSQSAKGALYDTRMCTPSPYAHWMCGEYPA